MCLCQIYILIYKHAVFFGLSLVRDCDTTYGGPAISNMSMEALAMMVNHATQVLRRLAKSGGATNTNPMHNEFT